MTGRSELERVGIAAASTEVAMGREEGPLREPFAAAAVAVVVVAVVVVAVAAAGLDCSQEWKNEIEVETR